MTVYTYIAENNPDDAYEICKKYGYFNVESFEDLSASLQELVAQNGEGALQEVLEIHPDKDVILELFEKKNEERQPIVELVEIDAKISEVASDFKNFKEEQKETIQKLNAIGSTAPSEPKSVVNQTNTYILVGALIVSLAIISMKKS